MNTVQLAIFSLPVMLNQLISSPLQYLLPIGKKSYGVYMLAVMLIKLQLFMTLYIQRQKVKIN